MKAKKIFEDVIKNWEDKSEPTEYAVAFEDGIEKTYGGDVDFQESIFEFGYPEDFFKDEEFMRKIHDTIRKLSELDDIPFNTIRSPKDLKDFFDWVHDYEIYATGLFDAMPMWVYEQYVEEEDLEDEDYEL